MAQNSQTTIVFTTLLIERSPQALPLGAACVASATKSNPSIKEYVNVELMDFCMEDSSIELLLKTKGLDSVSDYISEKILKKSPEIVAFSLYVWNHKILDLVANKIKSKNGKVICIAGGPEVTANPTNFGSFDYMIAGLGENSVPELIKQLINNENQNIKSILGVYNKTQENSFKIIRSIPLEPEKISSPYLDGTLDPSKYGGVLWELARGCPFKCSYCYESKGEQKISYFPETRLKKELDFFVQKKISQVFVLDPTYNANKERASRIISYIRKNAPDIFFYFEARAEFIDRSLAQDFSSITCALQIGLQSIHENVLKNVNRTFNKKLFSRNIGYLNEAGVIFGFDLIYGLPGDNLKGFKESIDFAIKLYPNNLELFKLSVLPGTDLFDKKSELGIIAQSEPPYNVIKTKEFNEKELMEAELLADAVNLFYTKGRAVSWFNSVIYSLKTKPSTFFTEFQNFIQEKKVNAKSDINTEKIRNMQIEFIVKKYKKAKLDKFILLVTDLINFFGALSDADGEGKSSELQLSYYPEDLLSEYALDFQFFVNNAKKHRNEIKVIPSPSGAIYSPK